MSNTTGYVGYSTTSSGEVAVSGAGSTWANSSSLYVGHDGSGSLTITDGASVSNDSGNLGYSGDASGTVTVSGAGTTWTNSSWLYIGSSGTGSLAITDGAAVSNATGRIGRADDSSGEVTVSGAGSTWTNSDWLFVGSSGTGSLAITDGAAVSNTVGAVGYSADSSGEATVSGVGSNWANSGTLSAGYHGSGSLTISDGAAVSNSIGFVGRNAGASGNVTVSGAGSTWDNNDHLSVGHKGAGTLSITGGGTVSNGRDGLIGWADAAAGAVTVSGAGATWSCGSNSLYLGGGPYWNGSDYEYGGTGTGALEVTGGGSVANKYGYLGYNAGASGRVTVNGAGSTWTNSSNLYVGRYGSGALSIREGGSVSNLAGFVGRYTDSSGDVTVSGAESNWASSDYLYVGYRGSGSLTVDEGGVVSNTTGRLGNYAGSSGAVTISGAGSTWTNSGNLDVGYNGSGSLTVADGATVRVNETLSVAHSATSTGTVNLQGGSLSAQSIIAGAGTANFNWTRGSLTVTGPEGLILDGGLLGPVVAINQHKALSVSTTTRVNSGVKLSVAGGTFYTEALSVAGIAQLRDGTITIGDTFWVNSTGELEISEQDLVLPSEPFLEGKLVLERSTLSVPSMTVIPGADLDLSSGSISVDGAFVNQDFVSMGTAGPATLRADSFTNTGILMGQGSIAAAMTNAGSIALGGDSSFTEDVTNQPGGKIIVSGGAAATFFDDVEHQAGADIRVSQDSAATFFGGLTGAGNFTGPGTIYIEGDLRPGSSPGEVSFGGDLVLGPGALLEIELGGSEAGLSHDVVDVSGRASLGGMLGVQLVDGFLPEPGDVFAVMTFGTLQGDFDAYCGLDLGEDLWLEPCLTGDTLTLTAVPEPSTLAMLATVFLLTLAFLTSRASSHHRPTSAG